MINVLVVEDSRVMRDHLVYAIETDPEIRAIGAVDSGEDALAFLDERMPDVILMDIHLPGIDGFETTRRIMSSKPVPIVVGAGRNQTVVNFDSLNAAQGPVAGALLSNYLAGFGITVATNISPDATLAVENQAAVHGGGAVAASSPPNLLTQIGSNGPVNYTVSFATWLTNFGFTRPELLASPFVSHPAWQATAFDAAGVVLGQAGEGLIGSYTNVGAQAFNLSGPGIASVQFASQGSGLATFNALLADDFVLTTNAAGVNFPASPASELQTPVGNSAADESVEFHLWKKRHCTEQKQCGFYSVLVPAVLGNIKNNDVKVLAEFLEPFGDDSVRATFGQNLRLRNIAEAALGSVYTTVKGISELADAPRVFAHSISCTGADTCKLGICLPKGALSAVNAKLSSSSLDLDKLASFQINFSGCPNTCGQHMIADLGFYGQALRKGQQIYPAYGIVAGAIRDDGNARLAQPIDNISAHDLPEFTAELLAIWLEKQWRFNSFAEYIDAEGKDDIRDICNRYRNVPDFDVDNSYYFDWGAQKPFTLAGRGLGECAAGLFDLIGVDRKFIEEQRKQLTRDIPAPARADALYRIVLGSARMLLVTRGVEARTDTAVFLSFEQHFISAGLVDEAHRPIVVAARVRDLPALLNNQGAVLALANAVRELYDNVDHTLRFPAEIARSAAAPA